jgi:hypothetical protein
MVDVWALCMQGGPVSAGAETIASKRAPQKSGVGSRSWLAVVGPRLDSSTTRAPSARSGSWKSASSGLRRSPCADAVTRCIGDTPLVSHESALQHEPCTHVAHPWRALRRQSDCADSPLKASVDNACFCDFALVGGCSKSDSLGVKWTGAGDNSQNCSWHRMLPRLDSVLMTHARATCWAGKAVCTSSVASRLSMTSQAARC